MKRLHVFASLLWLGTALSSAHAAPPSYQELHSNPERALPMQPAWHLRPVAAQAPPWEDIFVFTIGIDPDLMARSRWLSLNPGQDNERSERAPALFDTLDGHALFLSPAARSFCGGRWQAVWLERIGINTALQPTLKVWLVERKPEGGQRTTVAYGRIDAQGRWAVPPVSCDGKDTTSLDTPTALSYPMPGDSAQAASDLRVDTVAGQPGLRDAQGQWRTPLPQRDLATAQWMRDRQQPIPPGSTATGLVDAQGRAVIPFIFSELPDATAQRRIRLCTAAGQDRQLNASTPRMCRWQRLRGSNADAAPQPVKDTDSGRWGYQDAQGNWVIAPQFQAARPFRHGYAVVTGTFPQDWRPPGWQDSRPIIRKLQRMGRHWVAEAMVINASTGGQWALRYGVLNDAGQWLAPVPEPTLHVTVLFPPGGRSSHYAGMLASHLPNLLGRNVQVDHVPKATEADYRRLMTEGGNAKVLLAALRLPRGGIEGVHKGPPIDALMHSLRPVTLLASQPLVLAIDSTKADTLGIHSTDDLLAYARAHPGSLRIGTGEDGWTGHLAFGQFRALSGVDVQRVVFKGMYPDSDVITKAHAVDLLFAPVNGVAVAVQRGQLRVLGTTADAAHPQTFEGATWPALASSAPLAGYAAYDRFSLWAPADSDAASNRALQEAVDQVLAKPEVQKQLQDLQVVGGGGSPESLLALEDEERERWARALSAPASPPR
ncbi:tripartite tricarboxylate transporter substrate-binding protein [Variovorax sp. PAMC26660]|uniref:tripartite tricarboxylate transporter substrate-binding protein n=1 Tax=Variovorax sp. PAMC26660 TaxID=2762322 RepID=UPI00164D9B7A|nr:tripartite tricarboxylate transporter substrate-binding protein [Variovorax sp. PAMC26660]QNK65084.1 WG repeat-containing protein [Variovorax sp. PAMC26660]